MEDLLYLKRSWYNELDRSELRRGSAILRRLFIEDEYGKLWRILGFGKQPTVICVDLDSVLPLFDPTKMVFAFASGLRLSGIQYSPILIHEGDECTAYNEQVAENSIVSMTISKYLDSTAVFFDNKKISRRECVQFCANKLGGVHLEKLGEKLSDEFQALKKLENRMFINFVDAFMREIQCIGQAIVNSNDCNRVIDKYNEMISG